jgi:hypothetical protein
MIATSITVPYLPLHSAGDSCASRNSGVHNFVTGMVGSRGTGTVGWEGYNLTLLSNDYSNSCTTNASNVN